MSQGYIKLWRKSIDSAVWSDDRLWKLWTCCLLLANHKPGHFKVYMLAKPVEVLPGQFVTSRENLHSIMFPKKLKKNPSALTLWRWLYVLQDLGNLNITTNNKFSVVSINNWDTYQQGKNQNEQVVNSRMLQNEQQTSPE